MYIFIGGTYINVWEPLIERKCFSVIRLEWHIRLCSRWRGRSVAGPPWPQSRDHAVRGVQSDYKALTHFTNSPIWREITLATANDKKRVKWTVFLLPSDTAQLSDCKKSAARTSFIDLLQPIIYWWMTNPIWPCKMYCSRRKKVVRPEKYGGYLLGYGVLL